MIDILLVEDNKELSDVLVDFLRAEGYVVSTATNGRTALERYEMYGARLVILDIMLDVAHEKIFKDGKEIVATAKEF